MKSTDFDNETTENAEATAKSYLESNYNDIETIEIEEVYRNEMGGMSISGTVNNKASFHISMNELEFTIGSMGAGKGFPDIKEEYEDEVCDY